MLPPEEDGWSQGWNYTIDKKFIATIVIIVFEGTDPAQTF